MSKICVVSEELTLPFDEGIKNYAYNLIRELSKDNNILALSMQGDETDGRYIKRLNVNKTFLSYCLFREIRGFDPALILYIPSPSATIWSFVRTKILKLHGRKVKIAMVALQPRKYSFISQKLIPFLTPDLVLVQSVSLLKQLSTFGCCAEIIPSGVDLEKFHPVTKERKLELRGKYGTDACKFAILHVGHINRNRNIQILKRLQEDNNQVIIVGSTSTEQDEDLLNELKMAGVRVITSHVENIEEVYQLSDCYVFPVISDTASIGVPLSVLEAMACNLPVVTTRYGGLSTMFNGGRNGFFFVEELEDLSTEVGKVKKFNHFETRRMTERYSWGEVAKRILELV